MEFVFALPLLFVPAILPIIAGLMAKSFGRKFWPWFFAGIVLPLVVNIILLCLPDKSKAKFYELRPVENDEVFDHLFIPGTQKQLNSNENSFSATA